MSTGATTVDPERSAFHDGRSWLLARHLPGPAHPGTGHHPHSPVTPTIPTPAPTRTDLSGDDR